VKPPPDDLSQLSMLELFRVEAETQTALLNDGLLALERGSTDAKSLEALMRAAHSIKGAARIVNIPPIVSLAHVMEDVFVVAQHGRLHLQRGAIDVLLRAVDLLARLSQASEAQIQTWESQSLPDVVSMVKEVGEIAPGKGGAEPKSEAPPSPAGKTEQASSPTYEDPARLPERKNSAAEMESPGTPAEATKAVDTPERVLRLNAENLNRLLGLAGESLVESRWLHPFSESLQRLKRMHNDFEDTISGLRESLAGTEMPERTAAKLNELLVMTTDSRRYLASRLEELDLFDRRSAHLSNRLYLEVLRTRMRPFNDGVSRFPRMVRDVAASLGKRVRFEIVGETTQVDRDILERLETPLAHLLRNAVDHGCEFPESRHAAGKPEEALIRLEARHSAGMLMVLVSDDGRGVDTERVRRVIVERKLTSEAMAERLNEPELLEFLFLPGFTVKEDVTEISGRGVGLDVVQNLVRNLRGSVRVSTQAGRGTRFVLQLPLTLSVLRTLLVEIAGEPYAIPLAQIAHTLRLPRSQVQMLEGRHHFAFGGHQVGLMTAHQVLGCGDFHSATEEFSVVILGDRGGRYGLVVDRFLGERELVVQPLDARLGKVKDINAAALMEDGSPVLIVDVEDLVRSMEKLIFSGKISGMGRETALPSEKRRKRVLAVDDSLTVRELERKLLTGRGYDADVAVDGMDGWNALRSGHYDLVITDVDMPRMDGVELATMIKKDPKLKALPVMIVSYKDREEDRMRGMAAGADYYLTKGSFHDETLLEAVMDLIGEPEG
jgi:two-component system sensor histidine kinase and response regulator WspE